jgi:hypothetical protein
MTDRRPSTPPETPRPLPTGKAAGEYFTPAPIVRYIVRHTLAPLLADADPGRPLRVLEPACGAGAFLVEAYQQLLDWHLQWYVHVDRERFATRAEPRLQRCPTTGAWQLTLAERLRILGASLFGVELSAHSVQRSREALARAAAGEDAQARASALAQLAQHVCCCDALLDADFRPAASDPSVLRPFSWRVAFPDVWHGPVPGFDAVIGNPPYVNIRVLAQTRGDDVKRYLKQRYRCARGAYDLYVLFLERAWEVLRPDGVCGLIVPNKLATLQYASRCRALLSAETTILQIADLSRASVFPDAGVYPYIVIWRKRPPHALHRVQVVEARVPEELAGTPAVRHVQQVALSGQSGWQLHGVLDVEARVATRPLADVADVYSGSTGFDAARIVAALREAAEPAHGPGFAFIVSGNLDRYAVQPGPLRFMKRDFLRPMLPVDADCLTDHKRQLFASPKIVVAGMTTRLEAAWDRTGLALGVQVYAVVPRVVDPRYLLGLLNSKLLSYLFQLRFQAKHLAGGYLAVNKGQLAQLPICLYPAEEPELLRLQQRLIELVDQRQLGEPASHSALAKPPNRSRRRRGARGPELPQPLAAMDAEIDRVVYQLYRLTDDEIAVVEASVA